MGIDGSEYLSLADAATELRMSVDAVKAALPLVDAAHAIERPKRRGRPLAFVVERREVDRLRAEHLADAGAGSDALHRRLFDQLRDTEQRLKVLEAHYAELLDDFESVSAESEQKSVELAKYRRRSAEARRSHVRGAL